MSKPVDSGALPDWERVLDKAPETALRVLT